MSKPKVFEKPSGLKDYLPEAVSRLRDIESRVLNCMKRWGYEEIMTPTLEYYDTVGVASTTADRRLYKLLDKKGTTLVMRSDATAPIARVVSSLLKDKPLPLRLSYHANVFRSIEEKVGHEAEFFQTGVELIGDGSAEGDAEIIALAISCIKETGIEQFTIVQGHIGFLNGLFSELLGANGEAQKQLIACLDSRNYVDYRRTVDELDVSDHAKETLINVLQLRGGRDVCQQARQFSTNAIAHAALDHMDQLWQVLEAYGVADHVMIDLTMTGDVSYYTGMTFEGYAAELGFPICSGGRYDNLLQQFGRPAPAIGFALRTNRLLELVAAKDNDEPHRVLVLYTADQRQEAFAHAAQMRQEGNAMVETLLASDREAANEILTQYDAERHYGEIVSFLAEERRGGE